MKAVVIIAALMSLLFAAISANAQSRTSAGAGAGMGSAEAVLRAKGNISGADRIARAKCFSGIGPCSEKYAAQRARAMKRSHAQGTR